jgi:hypothetical protein
MLQMQNQMAWFVITRRETLSPKTQNSLLIGDVANQDVPEDWEDRLIFSIYGQQTLQGARTELTTATPVDVAVNFGLKYKLCADKSCNSEHVE